MARRHCPRQDPPPVVVPPVPDAGKRRHLSRAERRAEKERQLAIPGLESYPEYYGGKEGD